MERNDPNPPTMQPRRPVRVRRRVRLAPVADTPPAFPQRRAATIPCFAAGTQILTPLGLTPVETLIPGDAVLTVRPDGPSERKVTWTGMRRFGNGRAKLQDAVAPVLIRAGAVGPSVPERDLLLSPDHAIYIDGYLVEAARLVNGATIIRDTETRRIAYHHLALESHDVLLAENLPAESYLDCGGACAFEGSPAILLRPELAPVLPALGCAPLAVERSAALAAIRAKLRGRAVACGFEITEAIDAQLRLGARTLNAAMLPGSGVLRFSLPEPAGEAALLSATGVPTETGRGTGRGVEDRRALGIQITGITLISGGRRRDIPLTTLGDGFHEIEADGAGHFRWSEARGVIPLPKYNGKAVLEIGIRGQAPRWVRRAPDDRQSA